MNCHTLLERVAAGEWSPERPNRSAEAHLSICPDCRVRVFAADALGQRLRDPLLWEEPPAGLEQMVMHAMTGDLNEKKSVRPWWALIGVAAMAALILGVGWLSNRPDWSLELISGPEATQASAVVSGWNVGEGTRMVFDVTGLDDAPADSYYEVWLTAPDGRHVSAGTFRGPGRFEVMAGVRRGDYPRVWVTLEPADDDPGPFSATVLDTPREEA